MLHSRIASDGCCVVDTKKSRLLLLVHFFVGMCGFGKYSVCVVMRKRRNLKKVIRIFLPGENYTRIFFWAVVFFAHISRERLAKNCVVVACGIYNSLSLSFSIVTTIAVLSYYFGCIYF
jgi:hypothetical protein